MAGPTPTGALVCWVAAGGMVLATLAFAVMGYGVENEVKRRFYALAGLVTAVASVSYVALATGVGVAAVAIGGTPPTVHWARYLGWLLTTPLLLYVLALFVGADRDAVRTLLGLDAAMLLVGLAAVFLAPTTAVRLALGAVATVLLVALLYTLASRLSRLAAKRSEAVAVRFVRLRNLVVVVWGLYPVAWVLGPTGGLGVVGLATETALFALLDLAATVGFGLVLLGSHGAFEVIARDDAATEGDAEPGAAGG